MDMDYVLASINPPSVWNFFPTAEAAAAKADIVNEYSKRLDERLGAPERHYEVMTYEAYKAAERTWCLSGPLEEITEEQYREAFEKLPPEQFGFAGGLESFLMSEHFSGPYTPQYVTYQGRYFTRMVDATDRSTWITVRDIRALTQPEAAPAISHVAQVTLPPTERGR
jgi:hypothetical protein